MDIFKPPSKPARRLLSGALGILLLSFLVYGPALQAGFVWDDDSFLTANPLIKAEDGLYRFWFTAEAPDYFPLTSTMLWLEWRLWGMNPKGYHVVNVLLHAVSSILIWLTLKRLKIPGAWLAGLVFAVHPVNVESVAWITERKNTLPMVFYLLTILLYLRFEAGERRKWYTLSLIAFLLALLSKTSVVMLPFVLLLSAWWQRGTIVRRDLFRSAPFFALALILGLVTFWFQHHIAIGGDAVRTDGFLSRFAIAGWAVWFYLYKALVPINLSFVYPRWHLDEVSLVAYLPLLGLMGILGILLYFRNSWGRGFLFGLGFFVLNLLPVLGFVNIYFMKYSLVADHWQYTSIVGIIGLVVGNASWLFDRPLKSYRAMGYVFGAAVIGALSAASWQQCQMYEDEETLWRETIKQNRNAHLPHMNLGNILTQKGRFDEALSYYREALKIEPEHAQTMDNMAVALVRMGKHAEAMSLFQEAVRLDPNLVRAHSNLGALFGALGDPHRAIYHLTRAIEIDPKSAEVHNNLGVALAMQGRTDEAISSYTRAVELDPRYARALINKGMLLSGRGDFAGAIASFSRALEIEPHNVEARERLSKAFWLKGDKASFWREFKVLQRMDPNRARNLEHLFVN